MFRPATLMLVALAALVGAAFGVRQYAPQYLPDQFTTDAVLRERFRGQIAEHDVVAASFFDRFETLFPADYDVFMDGLVALYRRGGSEQQGRVFGETYMTSFVQDNQRHIANAEPAVLTALAAALEQGARTMRQEDPMACAQAMRGAAFSTAVANDASERSKAALTNIAVVMLDAIASGRAHSTQYARPTEQQVQSWLQRYEALGGDQSVLEALSDEARLGAVDPHALCQAGEIMWTAALQAEDDFAPRFISLAMSQ